MEPLNVVIVGAGRAGRELHVEAFAAQPGVRVVAVCDKDPARAAEMAQAAGVPHHHGDLAEALAAHQPQVVSICTPPQVHAEQVCQAVDAGADVLVEKPIAASVEEARRMWDYATSHGRKLAFVHNRKFSPSARRAEDLIRAGHIGRVITVQANWLSDGDDDRMLAVQDFWCHRLRGGRWAETAPHSIYLAWQFVGPMQMEQVWARKLFPQRFPWVTSDEVAACLRAERAYVWLRFSSNCPRAERNKGLGLRHSVLLQGSEGALLISGSRLHVLDGPKGPGKPTKRRGLIGKFSRAFRKYVGPRRRPAKETSTGGPAAATGHFDLIAQFIRHVRGQDETPVPWDEALGVVTLTEQLGEGIEAAVARSRS